MPCTFCGQDSPTVRAHALPEAFFRELRGNDVTLLMMSNADGGYTKRAPIGVYDQDVLCARCEVRFGPHDSYGADILINRRDEVFRPILHNGEILAFQGEDIDQHRLKMFVLSVLWRASVSRQPFFREPLNKSPEMWFH